MDKTVRQHERKQAELAQTNQTNGKRTAPDRKTKALKVALEALHKEVKNAESFYQDIHWLQDHFPAAKYEDVTGLCRLASPSEVREQEYSLNPGRYVGVVIEEDGKTEEEFVEEILELHSTFAELNLQSRRIVQVIDHNVANVLGEA